MNTNKLSAEYICEDEERLRMALHVYEAMPTVRKYLIKAIFKAAGERVAESVADVTLEHYKDSVYFYTEETGELYVFARVERRKGGALWLAAGLYVADEKLVEAQRDEIRERFETKVTPETWSYSGSRSSGTDIAWAWVEKVYDKHDGRWSDNGFLRRAILYRDEVVSDVAELLVRIYDGMFVQGTEHNSSTEAGV